MIGSCSRWCFSHRCALYAKNRIIWYARISQKPLLALKFEVSEKQVKTVAKKRAPWHFWRNFRKLSCQQIPKDAIQKFFGKQTSRVHYTQGKTLSSTRVKFAAPLFSGIKRYVPESYSMVLASEVVGNKQLTIRLPIRTFEELAEFSFQFSNWYLFTTLFGNCAWNATATANTWLVP